ncbi:unnamed protein product, partial [Effrenium voratum]
RARDTVCFNVAISACASEAWPAALHLLREMPSAEVAVDEVSYNAAISAVSWPMAIALLAEMKEVKLRADAVSYGAALKGSSWAAAGQLLQKMHQDQVQLDLIACNAAISACSASSRWTESLALYASLETPDEVSLSSTLLACQKAAQWEMSLSVLSGARRRSGTALNHVVGACEKASQWQAALLLAMEDSAVQSDAITYNAVISACDKGHQWLRAVEVLDSMARRRLQRDRISFYSAIHACETCGAWSCALELLEQMLRLSVEDCLGADSLQRRDYVHAFQAGDPIDCFKHVVVLALWQHLVASSSGGLDCLDLHAGAGRYDLRRGDSQFHRNFEDGVLHLDRALGVGASFTVMQYLQTLRRNGADEEGLRYYLGSCGLLQQWLRPQDRAWFFEASEGVMQQLQTHCHGGSGITLLQEDSYRWLLSQDISSVGRGLVLLDPPYDSVDSYHVWNIFMLKCLRQRWPDMVLVLWYPCIDAAQTQNLHLRLAELGEEVLIAEMEVQRPHEDQQSRAGMALLGAPVDFQHPLECELSTLARMLASSPHDRKVEPFISWLGKSGSLAPGVLASRVATKLCAG